MYNVADFVCGGIFSGKGKRITNRNGQQQLLSWVLCH